MRTLYHSLLEQSVTHLTTSQSWEHITEILGQLCTAANQLILRIRSDLVHRGTNDSASFAEGSPTEGGSPGTLCCCQQVKAVGL